MAERKLEMRESFKEKIKKLLFKVCRFWHKYDCCDNILKNCKICCKKNGYEYW